LKKELKWQAPFSLEKYKKSTRPKDVYGEKGYVTNEETPFVHIENGIWGGYTGAGAKQLSQVKR
jgi:hypothetical protein